MPLYYLTVLVNLAIIVSIGSNQCTILHSQFHHVQTSVLKYESRRWLNEVVCCMGLILTYSCESVRSSYGLAIF